MSHVGRAGGPLPEVAVLTVLQDNGCLLWPLDKKQQCYGVAVHWIASCAPPLPPFRGALLEEQAGLYERRKQQLEVAHATASATCAAAQAAADATVEAQAAAQRSVDEAWAAADAAAKRQQTAGAQVLTLMLSACQHVGMVIPITQL